MKELLIWCLQVYGLTVIVTMSSLMKPFRDKMQKHKLLGKLVTCALCFGFWAGIFMSVFIWSPSLSLTDSPQLWKVPFYAIADGCLGSSACWILHLYLKDKMIGA